MQFIFGGDTGVSYEQLQRERSVADALTARGLQAPQNLGEGISAIGNAIAGRFASRRADRTEARGRKSAADAFDEVLEQATAAQQMQAAQTFAASPIRTSPLPPPTSGGGGWDPALVDAVINQESGGDPNAVSPVGATGLMQVMPDTARDPGFGVPNMFDMARQMGREVPDESDATLQGLLRDPEVNQAFGTAYGNAMAARYPGDQAAQLAAYNAGPGAVDQYGGVPPFEETQNYVSAIQSNLGQGAATPAQPPAAATPSTPQSSGTNMELVRALSGLAGNQFLDPGRQQVVSALLQQQFAQPETLTPFQTAQLDLQERRLAAQLSGQIQTGTTVNVGGQSGPVPPQVGTIPQGFQMVFDPATNSYRQEIIPGGPADIEATEKDDAAAKANENTAQEADVVLQEIDNVKDKVGTWGLPETGVFASLLRNIGGTDARDVHLSTETIKTAIGFSRLQQMRDASPTGGALGNITERELANLQAALGSLDTTQSREQFLSNLERVEGIYTEILRKAQAYPNADEFGFGAGGEASAASGDNVDDLLEKYGG